MKLVTVPEMLQIEREADASGHSYSQMMENAGRGLAEAVRDAYSHFEEGGVMALVGSGNNGGDALVALTYLVERGWPAAAYLVRPRPVDDPLVKRLRNEEGEIFYMEEDPDYETLKSLLASRRVLMDGVLGTGIQLPLREQIAEVLAVVQRILLEMDDRPVVVGVDCPSGVDCQSGEAAAEVLPTDMTVSMAAVKVGLLKLPAFGLLGDLRVVGIGLPDDLPSWEDIRREVPDGLMVKAILPPRPLDAHKGTFGTVLAVAGSLNYTGAALLAGEAAFRIGAGWVTLAVIGPVHRALAGHFPEATWLPLPDVDGFIAAEAAEIVRGNLDRVTALLVGPGLGMKEPTRDFMEALIDPELPSMVVDADGLKILAQIPGWAARLPSPAILTPHPGEMAVLTGLPKEDIQANRIQVAEDFAGQWGHVVVLKGAFTVIAGPDGRTAMIPAATPALARAGTGDVLAGMMTGLRAQGVEAFPAAIAGAWLHAQAGLRAAEKMGSTAAVLAGDVLRAVGDVLGDLERLSD